jgi:hypothetical protein
MEFEKLSEIDFRFADDEDAEDIAVVVSDVQIDLRFTINVLIILSFILLDQSIVC